jgi:hypothetical protein
MYNIKDSYNLGLIPINESCPAEKNLELITVKLNSFNISLEKDIVAIMSDGTAIMEKFGGMSPAHQQLCYNHGLHLAVLKAIYTKKKDDNEDEDDDDDDVDDGEKSLTDNSDNDIIEITYIEMRRTI